MEGLRFGRAEALVPQRRLGELAKYGMRADASALRRNPDGRRLATLLATVRFLEGKSVDDTLELLDLLMATELVNKARNASNKEKVRKHPKLATSTARLAVAMEALFEFDGWGGPDEEPRVAEVWEAIEGPLPLAMRRADGAEPWPGYHDDLEMQVALVDSIVGEGGRSIAEGGELADLLAALPRDMSVHLDPIEWAAGPAPWGVSTMIARRIMLTERHPEPAGPAYPDGWEGFVPGLELQTVFLPEGLPHDHVPAKDELRPAAVHHQTEDALDHNRIADALRSTAGLLNGLSARIEDQVLEFLPARHPVRAALAAETRHMLDQALTLVDLADPAETAAEQEESS